MTRMTSNIPKVSYTSRLGAVRHEERPRSDSAQLPIRIAPRPKEFKYNILDPGEIRLLTIFPSQDHSTSIQTKLLHRRLEPSLSRTYEVLESPFWGSQEPRETVHVNEEPMTISETLLEALRHIRSQTEPKTIWVDTVCVNQNNNEERKEQDTRRQDILVNARNLIIFGNDKSIMEVNASHWIYTLGISATPSGVLGWKPLDLQTRNVGTDDVFNTSYCVDGESLSALTSRPGSPLANSISPSPGSIADFASQTTSLPEDVSIPPTDPDLWITNTYDCDLYASQTISWPEDVLIPPTDPDLWSRNTYDCDPYQLSPGDGAQTSDASTSHRKRSLLTAFPDEATAHCNQKFQQTRPVGADINDSGPNVAFACPFQKFDPHKYHKCLKYTLNRIKDVKQHIYRQHTRSPYYCPRCYRLFNSPDQRDKHSRRADCDRRDSPPGFEGISEDQKTKLRKSSHRNKSQQDQWFEVWHIIFPRHRHPQSAFIGNHVEEMIPLMRDLWKTKGSEIISSVIDTTDDRGKVDRLLLTRVVGSVFDRFEAEATRASPPGSSLGGSCSSEDSIAQPEFCFDIDEQDLLHFSVPDFDSACAVDFGNYHSSS